MVKLCRVMSGHDKAKQRLGGLSVEKTGARKKAAQKARRSCRSGAELRHACISRLIGPKGK
jgi:hypothetical protein